MKDDIVDFLVIGAGASGAAATWSLADTGTRIMCMEQGDWMKQADYPSNFRNWEVLQGWFTDLKKTKWSVSPNVRNLKADYPINDYDDSSVQIHNYNAVGGSTVHFGAHFPRFHPSDFKVKSLDGVADDWPIDYQQLEPYYNQNDQIIGVSGLEGNPAYPPKKSHLPPLPVGKKGDVIARGFNKLGWHWWPSDSAIISQPYEGRDKCINLSTCISGCTQGAKSSADVTYWPLALRRKGVELKTNCRVREITINKQGMADGVVYYDGEGRENRQKAEVVILACSAIGSPRILLNSTSQMFPNGLSNRSGMVGKNLMLHPWCRADGYFEEGLDANIGPVACNITSHEFYETDMTRGFVRGLGLQIGNLGAPLLGTALGMPWGASHHEMFRKYFGKKITVEMCCEDLPEACNQVTLDKDLKDSNGIPAPKITYRYSENSRKMMAYGEARGRELMEAAGAWEIKSATAIKGSGHHQLGTARMGKDPSNSVVNEWGRSHDVRNLFIVDGSIFVTSAACNPCSTIQALALFIADNIKKNIANLFD